MIPLPPYDVALPGLSTALDGDAMATLLSVRLIAEERDDSRIASCQPTYIRYKPGTSCLIQYNVIVQSGVGDLRQIVAHARLFTRGSDARLAASHSMARLTQRAARLHADMPLAGALHLPDLAAVIQVFPVDHDLRGLVRATSPARLRRDLGPLLPDSAGLPGDESPELVRYKPGRKALLRVALAGGSLDAVYAKVYCDGRGVVRYQTGRSLARAGIAAAEPLAYLDVHHMLVHPAVPGQPLAALRNTARYAAAMEATARELARLHDESIPFLDVHLLRAEMARVGAAARTAGVLLPSLRPGAERLAAAIEIGLRQLPEEFAAIHGDFYDDQALIGAGSVTLIDFDEAHLGHPAIDVANMLAHLTKNDADNPGPREAFLEAYRRHRPVSPAIDLFEAAALLKLAAGPFRQLEPDWPKAVARILELAVAAERRHATRRLAPAAPAGVRADPHLPSLPILLEPAAMRAVLAERVYREPVAVDAIDLVRHKPGRRALVRYDLRIGETERRDRLYGKTFASERGSRVYMIARDLFDARAFGADVQIPEPVAFLPDLKLILQREVAGKPLAAALVDGSIAVAVQIAEALHRLHASGIDLVRRHDLASEIDPLRDRVERLCESCPPLAARARACLALTERQRCGDWDWRWRPIHRDFHYEQVLIDGARLAVLDLDDAAMSEPAVDVANFVAHLHLLGLRHPAAASRLASTADAFTRRCRALDPDLDQRLVRWLEGATYLRLADIHLPRERGETIAHHLLDLAHAALTNVAFHVTLSTGRAPLGGSNDESNVRSDHAHL